ncbi:MAG: hypothetical protein D6830_02690 [Ignavibacteria bacterium]|nr:MAG: hypothetical protein D6830_02690 [Ignavibacteria bacterium]
MNLNQIIWYSLALGILGFTVIFIISLIMSRMNRKPLPYSEKDSLGHHSRAFNQRNVRKVNHYSEIKKHSIDLATQDIRIQRAQTYKRHAEVGSSTRMASTGSRFTVVNTNANSNSYERINPAYRTYTRGLASTSSSHFV